jgi:RNA polymerase sigma factor (sigma-70 family)
MPSQTAKTHTLGGVKPEQLWYVPDRRLRTDAAARDAVALDEWLYGEREAGEEPSEQKLFAVLHTCAYRAVGRPRRNTIPGKERNEWARRWQRIREYIVEKNLGLVYSMISRFGSRKVDEDDLLSDAMLGLTRAVDRFNPWRGYRFSTYACNVIARAMMRRGKRERHYRQLFPVQFDVSYEKPESPPDHQTELYVERLGRALDCNLGELTELESRILSKRFPNDVDNRLTFQEIGETVGLSKERVRQIQNVALRKLRCVLDEDPVLR